MRRSALHRFRDRYEAGRVLASKLTAYANRPDVIVLAFPRGSVPVACEVARALHAPLDVFLVRKLGVPGQAELAMGAVATGNIRVLNERILHTLRIPESIVDTVVKKNSRNWLAGSTSTAGIGPHWTSGGGP